MRAKEMSVELFGNKMKKPPIERALNPKHDLQYALDFTALYKSEPDKYLREAKCLEMQTPYIMSEITDDEVIVGLGLHGYVGFSPQWGGLYTYYFHKDKVLTALELLKNEVSEDYIKAVNDMVNFWEENATFNRHVAAFAKKCPEAHLPRTLLEAGFVNADVRLAGTTVDMDKLVRLGVNGLKADLAGHKNNFKNNNLYLALNKSIDTITLACDTYITKIEAIDNTQNADRLAKTIQALKVIRTEIPQTFFQGIQLIWIYSMISDLTNFGRLDEALGDLYVNDLNSGRTTKEQAVNDVLSLYNQIRKICKKHDARVILGGRGRRNESNADAVSMIFMEATRRFRDIVPQLTFRYYKGCSQEVYDFALVVNSEGCTFPIIYSDETNIPAVQKVYDVSYEEACQYLPFGCGEYVLQGLSLGTPNNGVNLLKALEITLHGGYDPFWEAVPNITTKSVEEISSFEDLFNQFTLQVIPYVKWLAVHKMLNYSCAAEQCGYLHYSFLMNDCFKNGLALLEGGVRYLNAASEIYGIISAADSFTAIKKLVYDTKQFTLPQVVKMLDANWQGYEHERKVMLNAPKYGNDDDYADDIAKKVFNFIADETVKAGEEVGLYRYNIVSVNNSGSAEWGYFCNASPDGRYDAAAMANANGASIGADREGITALLNSMSKIDPAKHVGVIHNVRFSKSMFDNDFDKIKTLLTTFYENNGVQTNIACINKDDLENALKYPEEYQNLLVRIGGFSEKFIELNTITQNEIIARTTYES